jgi:hypothetical protein
MPRISQTVTHAALIAYRSQVLGIAWAANNFSAGNRTVIEIVVVVEDANKKPMG